MVAVLMLLLMSTLSMGMNTVPVRSADTTKGVRIAVLQINRSIVINQEDKMGVLMDFSRIGEHCKAKADSTLNNMKKEDLIKYIRTLEHNYNVAVDFNIQQVKNFEMMESRIVEEIKKEKMVYFLTIANTGDKSLDIAYEKVGNALDEAIEIVKRGGISHGK